jgi:hypothetical protein
MVESQVLYAGVYSSEGVSRRITEPTVRLLASRGRVSGPVAGSVLKRPE